MQLREVLGQVFPKWSRLLKNVPPIDGELIALWEEALELGGVSAPELAYAEKYIRAKNIFFPTPSELIEIVVELREKMRKAHHEQYLRRLVECLDGHGNRWLAPPEQVLLGRLLPPGDNSGDGSQAPPALSTRSMPERLAEMSDGALKYMAVTASNPEAPDPELLKQVRDEVIRRKEKHEAIRAETQAKKDKEGAERAANALKQAKAELDARAVKRSDMEVSG